MQEAGGVGKRERAGEGLLQKDENHLDFFFFF